MKYMIISGAGGGLASSIIEKFKKDFYIFALDVNKLNLDKYKDEENIKSFVCDVCNLDEINKVKEEVLNLTDKIDVIINMAGVTLMGSAVEVEPSVFEKVMSINMFATYNINYTFFDLIKNTKGRIINVSSEYAKYLGIPFHSFYTSSKRANDIYSDSLRRELKKFEIKVIKIRPGAYDTNMVKNVSKQFDELLESTKYYKEPLLNMKHLMVNEIKLAKDPNKILKTFEKAIYNKNPKIKYDPGNSLKMRFFSLLPASLQDYILTRFFK